MMNPLVNQQLYGVSSAFKRHFKTPQRQIIPGGVPCKTLSRLVPLRPLTRVPYSGPCSAEVDVPNPLMCVSICVFFKN